MKSLYNLSEDFLAIYAAAEENDGELTPELITALEETESNLAVKADSYQTALRMAKDRETSLDAEIKRLTALKKTQQNLQKNLKRYIADFMAVTGRDRIEGNACKISLRRTRALDVDEYEALAPFVDAIGEFAATLPDYVKLTASISKTAIKEASFPDGILPQGVTEVENTNITIR